MVSYLFNPFTGNFDLVSVGMTGSGTTGYIPYWVDSTTLGDSSAYYNSSTNFYGINTTSPFASGDVLSVNGEFTMFQNVGNGENYFQGYTGGGLTTFQMQTGGEIILGDHEGNDTEAEFALYVPTAQAYFANMAKVYITGPGNDAKFGVNNAAPTYNVDVTGNLRTSSDAVLSNFSIFGDTGGVVGSTNILPSMTRLTSIVRDDEDYVNFSADYFYGRTGTYNSPATIRFRNANDDERNPTSVVDGHVLGKMDFHSVDRNGLWYEFSSIQAVMSDSTAIHGDLNLYATMNGNPVEMISLQGKNSFVGIHESNPSYPLDVVGQVRLQTLNNGSYNSVVVQNGGVLYDRTINSKVWGTLLDGVGGTNNEFAFWTDEDTLGYDVDFYYNTVADALNVPNVITESVVGGYLQTLTLGGSASIEIWNYGIKFVDAEYNGIKLGTLSDTSKNDVLTVDTTNEGRISYRTPDTRIWGSDLISGSGAATQIAYFDDTDNIVGETGFEYNSATNTFSVETIALNTSLIFDSQTLTSAAIGTSDNDTIVTQGYVDDADSLKVDRSEWSQNGFVNPDDSTISFVDGTRTFTITPISSFSYYIDGVEYVKSVAEDVVITDVSGSHYIYYDGDTLTAVANPTDAQIDAVIRTKAIVSIVYWNATESENMYLGEERHGMHMSPSTHSYIHFVFGLQYLSGLGLGDFVINDSGDDDEDAQFSTEIGGVTDEDLYKMIPAVGSTTGLPIYYRSGTNGDWIRETNTGFSVRTYDNTNTTRLAWNENTGATWQLSEISNNDFVLCHVFATTELNNPLIAIMGQAEYGNLNQARLGATVEVNNLLLGDLPGPEVRPIATVIFQTSNGYANEVKARVRTTDEGDDYVDWRTSEFSRGTAASSHGSLSGLANNDHPQYPLVDEAKKYSMMM